MDGTEVNSHISKHIIFHKDVKKYSSKNIPQQGIQGKLATHKHTQE